jgi:hypothetical protein
VTEDSGAPLVMGVDVARKGSNESVILLRRGRDARTYPTYRYKGMTTMDLAEKVASAIQKHNPDAVFIDGGGVGGGVVDRLKQLGYRVIEVQSGSSASDPERYLNKRAEMWGEMRDWLSIGCIENDQTLIDDLAGPEYDVTLKGQIKLETKEQMLKRGLPSPDSADALGLTFAEKIARTDSAANTRLRRLQGRVAETDYDVFST